MILSTDGIGAIGSLGTAARSAGAGGGIPSLGRVLLLTASVGGGHTRAAEATAESIRHAAMRGRLRFDRIEVIDTLAYARSWFRTAYRGTYLGLLDRAPTLVGWLYERSDRAFRGVRSRWATAHAGLRPLRRKLDEFRPDTIVSTHFLPAEYLAGLRRRGRLDARLVTIVTDVHAHGMWLADPCDQYCVATDESRLTLEAHGIERDRIAVTGIPIDPAFATPIDREAARRIHGLPSDRPVVLFSTGGACVGPIEKLYRQLLDLRTPCELLAITGKSAVARDALARIAATHAADAPVRTRVVGYTTAMHELMAAADLLVGKPGGLTSAETRAMGLPMAIVHAVPGQEEHNAAALLEAGCAIRCASPHAAAWKIDRLLAAPETLRRMGELARSGAQPSSGARVAETLATLAALRG
jgi:processive 1,2-diacylglycerol beta-glucosyltransferase